MTVVRATLARRLLAGAWLALVLAPGIAMGCQRIPGRIADYTGRGNPAAVVFAGRVVAVEAAPATQGATAVRISILVTQWFAGGQSTRETVSGFIDSGRGTSCEGMFDFPARVGERWLVFGKREGQAVVPDITLSQRLDGAIPATVLQQLPPPRTPSAHRRARD